VPTFAATAQFYTGWLTHWGEQMANTSSEQLALAMGELLAFANSSASVNLYMAHGGTNFGFWAGAGLLLLLLLGGAATLLGGAAALAVRKCCRWSTTAACCEAALARPLQAPTWWG
jgi:hypothetical protein